MILRSISIIGGGRWAREIADVVYSLADAPARIVIHSRRNEAGIATWISRKQYSGKVFVSPQWPDFRSNKPSAVIVANEVSGHFMAASHALEACVPVLIEKPLAIPSSAVKKLCDSAAASQTILAASHVFLFARYLDTFATVATTHGRLQRLSFVWHDGQSDIRRSEAKSYDPSVSVFDDMLPHVVPMIDRLHPGDVVLTSLDVQSGGAQVSIKARTNELDVAISLARNSERRRRIIVAETEGGICSIDFSEEPGLLTAPGIVEGNGDLLWDSAPRPLGSMLAAFLTAVGGGSLDARLSPAKALASATFADAVREQYRAHQISWLDRRIGMRPDTELAYALQETDLAPEWKTIESPAKLRAALLRLLP
jgi:predicted dehydrogenase